MLVATVLGPSDLSGGANLIVSCASSESASASNASSSSTNRVSCAGASRASRVSIGGSVAVLGVRVGDGTLVLPHQQRLLNSYLNIIRVSQTHP